jgi:hypothetical protein
MLSLPFNRRLLPERLATLLVVGSAVYTVWFWTRIETDRAMVRRAWLLGGRVKSRNLSTP